ncbi:hypothetical protein [Nocardia sp. NPDC047648]|uniref:hypothetical protein n=1 Tax=Nocardia sp. NPDC047648 TaxID=3155625 RepID=UPI0033E67B3E
MPIAKRNIEARMTVAKSQVDENQISRNAGERPAPTHSDLIGLVAILLTAIALVALVGAAATAVLAAAGGFVVVTLRLWLRRR